MEAPHRHDLVNWTCVNKEIELFNRLLAKRLKLYKQVSIGRLHLDRKNFTKHGLHLNYEGKERMCQQIAELVQQKLRAEDKAFPGNTTPLKYKKDTVQEEAVPQLKCKEDNIHEEVAETQENEAEKTSADPCINYVIPSERDQQQEI
jgi:hypothetical protein